MTFYQWLVLQKDRNDWVGDLSQEVIKSHDHPRGGAGYQAWRDHIIKKGGIHAIGLEALDLAWKEYQSFDRDKTG